VPALPSKIQLFLTAPPQLTAAAKHTGFPFFPISFHHGKNIGSSVFPSQAALPQGQVLISTAISGGTLLWRLEESIRHYGRERILPALERTSMDFPLPAPDGIGVPLSPTQLQRKINYYSPAVHFSSALCAQYFLYRDGEQRPHFVLFDDPASFRRKLALLRSLGLTSVVASYPQIRDWLEEMKGWEELSSQPR